MDQSENFEPDKKRSARRPQQEQDLQGGVGGVGSSSAGNRRPRYSQPQLSGTVRGQLASSYQPQQPQQLLQQSYGIAVPSQQQQQARHPGGYPTASAEYGTNLTAMATASYPNTDPYVIQQEHQRQQQLLFQQQQQQQQVPQQQRLDASAQPSSYAAAAAYPGAAAAAAAAAYPYYHPTAGVASAAAGTPPGIPHMPVAGQSYIQPRAGRLPSDRPLIKLSISLIDTYKHINTVYYEERDARRKSKEKARGSGTNNNGWDDDNYDYIITPGELFYGRYRIKERIGKGSFGQVVRAEDIESKREVAIKIIKSKKPFLMQAKTEIELLTHLWEKDQEDEHNIVRLLTHFMYRNHQCLVFEMLSLNLYELLKNTQFGGVSLNLIRKFAKQVLKALSFLGRKDVDIIHCDLKPENILLRHPKKSGVKVIDFGSSCHSNKRMYSYIQSRFYRSPEVMLGLPYTVSIDMWSLGCILVEMHTGEPLFSGSDQFDQMQKIVKVLGMIPDHIMEQTNDHTKQQFFEKMRGSSRWTLKQSKDSKGTDSTTQGPRIVPSINPIASLTAIITAGAMQKKKYPHEAQNSARSYELFIDLVYKMLIYEPKERIKPLEAMEHPFITESETGGQAVKW